MDAICRSQQGDMQAFATLFQQYKNLVFRTACLMLDDPVEAEDALQEVFVQVFRSLPSYDPDKAAFTTWLYRITVHHCLNRRRNKRLSLLPLTFAQRRSSGSRSLEERVSQVDEVQQALGKLSDKLRATVILRFYNDLSYAEIAEVFGVPLGTVQSRLHKAMQLLRHELRSSTGDLTGQLDLLDKKEDGR